MTGRNGASGEAATLPTATRSWLVESGADRDRLLDMDKRLRPVRRWTFVLIAGALAIAAPWVGWWTLAPLLGAVLLFRMTERRVETASYPEYWMFGAWAGAEAIIAVSVASMGASGVSMLALLAIPVVTLSARFSLKGIWAGVAIASFAIVAVAFAVDPRAVADEPPLLIAPLAVVGAAALLSTALMQSDVEHRDKAVLDPLTGLLNRTSLAARAKELEQQSAMSKEPVGVVLLDLDKFKEVNDSYGHASGDGVLMDVAYRLRKGLRSYDYIYRIGGDEFLILVPGADVDGALAVGRSARAIVSQVTLGPSNRPMAASCGVGASELGEVFDFKGVLVKADCALYAAKKGDGLAIEDDGLAYRIGVSQA